MHTIKLKIKNHGSLEKYHHDIIGYNSRLDEMQAAILNIKLKYINQNNAKRVKNAEIYNNQLSKLNDIQIPQKTEHGYHVYHQYTINSILRDKIKTNLEKNKIGSAILLSNITRKTKSL